MPPIAILKPNETWQKRALLFSTGVLALVLIGGYFVPVVLLLAPFVLYRWLYHFRALQGRLRIEVHENKLVCKPAFGKKFVLERPDVKKFLSVYNGDNEVVVARREEVDRKNTDGRQMIHKSDVVMPGGLMRNPGLVARLESWRLGTFSTDYLFGDAQPLVPPDAPGA